MSYNPAKGFPRAVPELLYQDAGRALEWLTRVFGFRELLRYTLEDKSVAHADLELEGGIVMMALGGDGYQSPIVTKQSGCVIVFFVRDVDQHFQRVSRAKATIISPPSDKPWGLRQYRVADIEGHLWEFTQHLRDVKPEDWGAMVGKSQQ